MNKKLKSILDDNFIPNSEKTNSFTNKKRIRIINKGMKNVNVNENSIEIIKNYRESKDNFNFDLLDNLYYNKEIIDTNHYTLNQNNENNFTNKFDSYKIIKFYSHSFSVFEDDKSKFRRYEKFNFYILKNRTYFDVLNTENDDLNSNMLIGDEKEKRVFFLIYGDIVYNYKRYQNYFKIKENIFSVLNNTCFSLGHTEKYLSIIANLNINLELLKCNHQFKDIKIEEFNNNFKNSLKYFSENKDSISIIVSKSIITNEKFKENFVSIIDCEYSKNNYDSNDIKTEKINEKIYNNIKNKILFIDFKYGLSDFNKFSESDGNNFINETLILGEDVVNANFLKKIIVFSCSCQLNISEYFFNTFIENQKYYYFIKINPSINQNSYSYDSNQNYFDIFYTEYSKLKEFNSDNKTIVIFLPTIKSKKTMNFINFNLHLINDFVFKLSLFLFNEKQKKNLNYEILHIRLVNLLFKSDYVKLDIENYKEIHIEYQTKLMNINPNEENDMLYNEECNYSLCMSKEKWSLYLENYKIWYSN